MDSFAMNTTVVTQDRSSGRLHKRLSVGKSLFVDERCNLDDAGAYDVLPRGGPEDRGDGVPVGTDAGLLCKYCFPVDEDTTAEEEFQDRV